LPQESVWLDNGPGSNVIESFKTSIWALEKQMRVLKLSMTFEPGPLPTRHFLEANTTHSFYSVLWCDFCGTWSELCWRFTVHFVALGLNEESRFL
jgi:hypothetical protein